MASGSSYQPSEGFTFSKPQGWPIWIKRFKRYRIASSLDLKDEERQVFSLIYSIGEEAEDIVESFRLSDDKQKSYETVRGRFELYFVDERNVVFDRVSFFQEDNKRESQFHLLIMTYMPWLNIATLVLYMMK